MLLPLVHSLDYVTPLPEGHRFPMPKFNLLREVLVRDGVAVEGQFVEPPAATFEQATLVHEPAYIEAFCSGRLDAAAMRKIGLPWSAGLVKRTLTALGGSIRAAELAVEHGLACNLAGGTHHAFAAEGSGFCIVNDLAVAPRWLQRQGLAEHVLIIDLDVHQGDGTAALFAGDPTVFTFSMHCGKNFPLRKARSDLDVEVAEGVGDEEYLRVLREGEDGPGASLRCAAGLAEPFRGLEALLERVEPDVVFYDAGVDVHADDALGKLRLSDAGIYERDRFVIETCRSHGVPVCCVIGGGYDRDHVALARRHSTVHRAATTVWEREQRRHASTQA